MKLYRIHLIVPAILLLIISGCKKDFLNVNEDPNYAKDATSDRLLPATIGLAAYTIGNQYNVLGGVWGQYWTQGPTASQYEILDKYLITSTTYNRPWEDVYQGPLTDLKTIVAQSTIAGETNYVGIAKIWQAYIYQILTDAYGDIPFSESNQGEGGNLIPKYDTQEAVYDGLIKLIDEGLIALDPNVTKGPKADDLIYGGDIHKWINFANTLKLKIYLRQVNVRREVAEAGIKAMMAEHVDFITEEDQAEMKFFNAQFNNNPLNELLNFIGIGNLIASNTSLNYLRDTEDPRLGVFFDPAANGNYIGINQGEGRLLPNPATLSATNYSKPSPNVGGIRTADANAGKTAPVIFISTSESYFLQAEAALYGWGGDPQELYESGITSSLEYWNEEIHEVLDGDEPVKLDSIVEVFIDSTVAFPSGSQEEKLEAIITQKWVAMTGMQNLEAWTEFRRTGYPSFLIVSLNSKIGNKFPTRLLYPDSESTRNPNTPPQKPVDERMWWDVN